MSNYKHLLSICYDSNVQERKPPYNLNLTHIKAIDKRISSSVSFVTKEVHDASILYEVPKESGDQEPEEDHHEE